MSVGALELPAGLSAALPRATVVAAAFLMGVFAFSRETASGDLAGTVSVNDRPLAGIRVVVRPSVPASGRDSWVTRTDNQGRFSLHRLPTGAYEVQPLTQLHRDGVRKVLVTEGRVAGTHITVTPEDPFLRVHAHQRSFLPGEQPRLQLNGFRQGERVRLELWEADFTGRPGPRWSEMLDMLARTSYSTEKPNFSTHPLRRVRSWQTDIRRTDAEGQFYQWEPLGALPAGLYVLRADGERSTGVGWVAVSDLCLISKASNRGSLLYTADLKSGSPLAGVDLYRFRQGSPQVTRAQTDAQGVATVSGSGGDGQETWLARKGASLAVTRRYSSTEAAERFRAFTYTDRPVYRPGHKVHFKGVVRRIGAQDYRLPGATSAEITVRDESENVVTRQSVEITPAGSYSGEFELSREATAGMYSLILRVDGEDVRDSFFVASYRKPEWSIDVSSEKKRYVRGDRIRIQAVSRYFFGAPVAGAKATWTVSASPHWSWGDEEDLGEEESEGGSYGELIAEGQATTDAEGRLAMELPSNPTLPASTSLSSGQEIEYNVQVTVEDASSRVVTESKTIVILPGELSLHASPSNYVVSPGQAIAVKLEARNLDDTPAVGIRLEVRHQLKGGARGDRQSFENVETDSEGRATVSYTPSETGLLEFQVRTTDRRGNKLQADTDVWVARDAGEDINLPMSDLSVRLDRKSYLPGDTAVALIQTDRPGATALVTIEADRVLRYWTVPLPRRSTVVRIPVEQGWVPNVYVGVCRIRDRQFATSEARLSLSKDIRRLKVTVSSDRPVYRPGEQALFTVQTAGPDGKPCPAEVSFGLVDEAIYAIREEPSRGIWEAFFPRRYNGVSTSYSDWWVYLGDADKSTPNVEVRRNFQDTAAWAPFVHTNEQGRASVRVTLPDNLTRWRATAVAHNDRTDVGRGVASLVVRKELMVRLQTPRTLTAGDQATFSAVVHNEAAGPMDVVVKLGLLGADLTSPMEHRLRLDPATSKKVEWRLSTRVPGSVLATVTAVAGALSDGVELSVPVRAFARPMVETLTGIVTDAPAVLTFRRQPSALDGELSVRVSPSIASSLLGSLRYLAEYPYGCTEQTTSSFLPDVLVHQLNREFHLDDSELAATLPGMVQAGLLRLYRFQTSGGSAGGSGWGWWQFGAADTWLSAYVMMALQTCKDSGIPVNEAVYASGSVHLKGLASAKLKPDDACFVAYVLALTGKRDLALKLLTPTVLSHPKLERRSLGYAILALARSGSDTGMRRARELLETQWAQTQSDTGGVRWSEDRNRVWYRWVDDVETTAVLLKAVMAVSPSDPRAAEIVRWLMSQRRGDGWISTRDTAWVLYAMVDYLRHTRELSGSGDYEIRLNGSTLHRSSARERGALPEETVLSVPFKDLQETNQLEIRGSDGGRLYYTARLKQDLGLASFAPESSVDGLSVEREYYPIARKRDARGRVMNEPASGPRSSFRVGETILVRVRVKSSQPLRYFMLEDPIPSGFEVVDRGEPLEWSYWWSALEVRDDRVATFLDTLPTKEQVIEYYLRPELPGSYRCLPPRLSDMYAPERQASGSDRRLEVRP